jgi:PAS domain S-box-containing protein
LRRYTLEADSSGAVIATVLSLDDVMGVLAIDELGMIRNCNEYVSRIFGHSMEKLNTMNVADLMPRPYSLFHSQYIKRYKAGRRCKLTRWNPC